MLPGRWTAVLLGVVGTLLVAHLAVSAVRLHLPDVPGRDPLVRFLDVDAEMSGPTWFSVVLLAATAQALWLLADRSARGPSRRWVRHERFLSLVFVYLSVDELTALHEQTIAPLRSALDLGGVLTFAWVVLFAPVALLVGLVMLGWLRSLPPAAGRLVVLSGVVYVGGAVGMELVGSALYARGDLQTMTYALTVAGEEGLEMLGVLLLLSVVTWLRRRPEPLVR